MSRAGGTLRYVAMGVVVALFAASALVTYSRIEDQKRELQVERNSILWLATSLQVEYLQLITELARYTLAPDADTLASLRHRLDITWSRLPVLLEGSEAAPLRRLPSFNEVMDRTREVLQHADDVLAEDVHRREALVALEEEMLEARHLLQDFLTASMLTDELAMERMQDRARSLQHGLYGSFLGMLLSGAALVLLLVRQIGAVSRARARTEEQRRALETEVAERLRANAALRESESRFRDFAEAAADWFWETDGELRFGYLSERFEEVMGLPAASVRDGGLERLAAGRDAGDEGWTSLAAALDARREVEGLELRWRRPDGGTRELRLTARPVFDAAGGFAGYRGVTHDITRERRLAEQMEHLASHDPLTGLVNRREFEQRLERVIATAREDGGSHALCFLDLDQFKIVNDTCGHVAGDELIRQVAAEFGLCVRKRDTLARLGGDEFGVLVEHCDLAHAQRVAESLRRAVEAMRFSAKGRTFTLSVSIGLVGVDAASESVTEVLSAADSACYAAKHRGRNQIHVFRADDDQHARRRGETRWLAEIQRALDADGFELVAQDIVPLAADEPADHFEVLLRLVADDGERVLPGTFLPAAERYHVSPRVDRWVIRHALEWLAEWRTTLAGSGHCFVNLSGQSLGDAQMLDFIVAELRRTGVDPARLCLEVTETAAISNLANATRLFRDLRARGCRFALDDFGSGVSSFGYLRTLPVDYLKIDGAFVRDIADDRVDLAMVRSINEIGQLMGKKTIAEFVETEAVLTELRRLGVDYAQGYHLGVPAPLAQRRPAVRRVAVATR